MLSSRRRIYVIDWDACGGELEESGCHVLLVV